MKINTHAGHNPDGKIACGAVGLVKESTVAREINKEVIVLLTQLGHTTYDCTVDNGTSQNDVLKKIVAKCNANEVDADVSIHLNSGRNDSTGDNSIGGTEILVYSDDSEVLDMAIRIAQKLKECGFRLRSDKTSPAEGVKIKSNLYVLKQTSAPALLIETFFCDDADDVKLYQNIGAKGMAKAIVEGITGQTVVSKNDINKDGKVDLADAQEALKQGLGVTPGDATLEDAHEILQEAIGVTDNKTHTKSTPAAAPAKPSTTKPTSAASKNNQKVLEFQKAAIADGFEFPKYGADGAWGSECESVARKAVIKRRTSNGKAVYKYPNLTKIVQRAVGVKVDGKCGNDTSDAIGAYQRSHGLRDDKCVGLKTWKKILGIS